MTATSVKEIDINRDNNLRSRARICTILSTIESKYNLSILQFLLISEKVELPRYAEAQPCREHSAWRELSDLQCDACDTMYCQ